MGFLSAAFPHQVYPIKVRILKHCDLWKEPPEKVPKSNSLPEAPDLVYDEGMDFIPDYTVFDDLAYEE